MERIKRKPFHSEHNRKKVLESLRCVDEVIIFNEDTPIELIKKVKPTYITKGGDYEPEYVVGKEYAMIKILDLYPSESSSKILEFINGKT